MDIGSIASRAKSKGGSGDPVEGVGRAGLVAQGALYGVIAILAARVAAGARSEKPDKDGAIEAIAAQPFGTVLLAVFALGLAGYALWRLAQAALDRENDGDGPAALVKRAGYLGRGLWYGGLCVLTVQELVGAHEARSGSEKRTTAGVFDWPLGREVVYAAGLTLVGAGAWNLYRGVACRFESKLKSGEMSDTMELAVRVVGIVGHIARAVVFALVGLFLLRAAWQFDPKEAVGLDGALLKLAQAPYGGALLGAVAAGLGAFALQCFAQARYRDV